jgi:uncharacterized protein (DUF1501 family)
MGEFGRTPKVNSSAGRDHWSQAMFITMGGGGVKCGLTVGETDRIGEAPANRPITVEDFAATVYKTLGIDYERMYMSPDARPIHIAAGGDPISEVL